ncbi:threonine ammonia-lyase [Actinomadura oligospora]|uniref:threonine ammonia-lyase n=1 Tax=Actinomadura oligospora TaxID=111804 RepID=UPI00047ED9A7|nr:pyridoxal-phosphate dependent enzyme [Actinomadura oligospora]
MVSPSTNPASDGATPRPVRTPTAADLRAAAGRVAAALDPTPVLPTALAPGALLKAETLQPTGSFKIRGAVSAIAGLTDGARAVTASAGNHGLGFAHAAARSGVDATVVVSEHASPAKVAKLASYPVDLVRHGADYDAAEAHALSLPGRFVSPYNDPDVIAGQGTIGVELDAQAEGSLTVVAPVGGGGLLAGLALWASTREDVRLVGVESSVSRAVSAAVAAGRVVPVEVGDSIADGLVGNLEPGSVTPALIATAEPVLTHVSDAEIRSAMRWLFTEHGLVAEGSGAAGVAAVLAGRVEITGRLVIVLTGRNVTIDTYQEALGQ